MFITNIDGSGIVGSIAHDRKGYRFISRVSSHGNGRRGHNNPKDAIPRWARPAYFVKATTAKDALAAVKAYRKGAFWSLDLVDIVR